MADLTAPGAHPQEAVEAVAKALPRATRHDSLSAARALLDRIAPLLIAAERESCAKVVEALKGDDDVDWAGREVRRIPTRKQYAAAIRERAKA